MSGEPATDDRCSLLTSSAQAAFSEECTRLAHENAAHSIDNLLPHFMVETPFLYEPSAQICGCSQCRVTSFTN